MKSIIHLGTALFLLITAVVTMAAEQNKEGMQLLSIQKIWDAGTHNAFTDLIRFEGKWFCTFREGERHVGGDGKIRVLVSSDGKKWESAALLEESGIDLRDPKLSITPNNRLMLTIGGSIYEGKTLKGRRPRVSLSEDGRAWTVPQKVLDEGDWLWRVTWHKGAAYGMVYVAPTSSKEWTLKLVQSPDGLRYSAVTTFDIPGRPNEATIRFSKNGEATVLVRREAMDKQAWIGSSKAPYTHWTWKACGMQVGGPNFIYLPDGTMIAGGRQYHAAPEGAKMFVGRMTADTLTPELTLPSGGDCSYPGFVLHRGKLWVSYYASHEGKSSIYLATVKLQ
jgi:hypothetical protein